MLLFLSMPQVIEQSLFLFRFGVCCVFILTGTGSTTVTQNCTYIQNTGFPSALTGTTAVSYTVQKCSCGK